MRKYLVSLVLIVIVSTLLWGCKSKTAKPQGAVKATIKNIEVGKFLDLATEKEPPKAVVSEAHNSVKEFIKKYTESAFLDLALGHTTAYESTLLKFFTKDAQTSASTQLGVLSLGVEAKKLNYIFNNDLKVPIIATSYDKSNKASLSSVKVDFEASYKAALKKADLTIDGWLVLTKEGNDWKIFDYKLEQHLR